MNITAERLVNIIQQNIPEAKMASGGKEITFRCPFCGDSIKDRNARHFYMSLPTDDTPSLFRCFKCDARGVTTPRMLASIGITDSELAIGLEMFNSSVLSMSKNQKYSDSKIYYLKNYISECEMSYAKLGYINKRLGLNLNFKDLIDNKIVLNLFDLFQANPNLIPTRDDRIMRELNGAFLGFISLDNCFVNMKNLMLDQVSKNINKRYINYVVFNKYDNTQKYYVPPININYSKPGLIKIHIAEGPFDILSIKYNLRKEIDQNIYVSMGGNTYLHILETFIKMYGLINVEPHIYLDNDVDAYRISNDIADYISDYNMSLYIHTNVYPNEKDFGVDLSHIKEEITKFN